MVDMDAEFDDQDHSEIFDEENTNDADRGPGEDAEQFEDLVDVYDVTSAVGDDDDDEGLIGEDMDDEEIVAAARDDAGDDFEDDDLVPREAGSFQSEDELDDIVDVDDVDVDDRDRVNRPRKGEVELQYAGDLADFANAASSARDLESESLSDADLRELDYKDEFTRDEDEGDAHARR